MKTSIFFSWQGDTPTGIGRNFLRKALEEACKEIAAESCIDEAMREKLVVDSDTQGEAGQPPIAETIFKKIDAAAVFVADMTFTAKRMDGRPTPNPNVLIEYGWALKSLSHSRVISVMNDVYGEPSAVTLPFDLAHVRWPIRFAIQENDSTEQKAEGRRNLVASLKVAIKASLAKISPPPVKPTPIFPKAGSKDGPARFRSVNEELGHGDGFGHHRFHKVFLKPGPAMWLRIMPSSLSGKTWTSLELKEMATAGGIVRLHPLSKSSSYSFLRAEDGWGTFNATGPIDEQQKRSESSSIAFAFATGEIWSIDTALLTQNSNRVPFIESAFNASLSEYANFINGLGVPPPYHWIAGITGIKGRHLQVPSGPSFLSIGSDGPFCLSDAIQAEGEYRVGQEPGDTLRPFYSSIFEKSGIKRPSYLDR